MHDGIIIETDGVLWLDTVEIIEKMININVGAIYAESLKTIRDHVYIDAKKNIWFDEVEKIYNNVSLRAGESLVFDIIKIYRGNL